MADNNGQKGSMTQMWVMSLAISVFCCAIFFAFLSMYVTDIGTKLTQIDEQLVRIEQRVNTAPVAPPAQPIAVVPQMVVPPGGPVSGSEIAPSSLPSAAPIPEAPPEVNAPSMQDGPTPLTPPVGTPPTTAPQPGAAAPAPADLGQD